MTVVYSVNLLELSKNRKSFIVGSLLGPGCVLWIQPSNVGGVILTKIRTASGHSVSSSIFMNSLNPVGPRFVTF